jgi:hypothetical protein
MLQITRDDGRKSRVLWRNDDTLGVEFTERVTSVDAPNPGHGHRNPSDNFGLPYRPLFQRSPGRFVEDNAGQGASSVGPEVSAASSRVSSASLDRT